MVTRRALVSQTRVPEVDRDSGSQDVDFFLRFLQDAGWSVTFLAVEEDADPWHARRLRQRGVETHAGLRHANEVVRNGRFDLAVLAFWEPASELLPIIRSQSPTTRVVIDSVDLHFLRNARRGLALDGVLDDEFGAALVRELNTYAAADMVLAVSDAETALLGQVLDATRVRTVAIAEGSPRSDRDFDERSGMVFVGNFRHVPNREAVEYLCRDVLPQLDPEVLLTHRVRIVGNRLDDSIRACGGGISGIEMVGWVPSVLPYLEAARVCVVPLLHGAGVKRKVLQAMMAGTPVVTTSVGAEGLDLVHDQHALIADDAAGLAAATRRLLGDSRTWRRLAHAAREHVARRHSVERVRARFLDVVDETLARPAVNAAGPDNRFRHGRDRAHRYRAEVRAVVDVVEATTEPGSTFLVVSKGDDTLLCVSGRIGRHFPQSTDGGWAGYHPADSESAVRHLEALRQRGARYLVFPASAFWWLHHYHGLVEHLEASYRRVHGDEHVTVFDLRAVPRRRQLHDAAPRAPRRRVAVVGSFAADRPGPPAGMVAELECSAQYEVVQQWSPRAPEGALERAPTVPHGTDWILQLDDTVVLPSSFLDDFFGVADEVGADRAQPAHANGPSAGPPVAERVLSCVARTLPEAVPTRVFAQRVGASSDGPVLVVDAAPVRVSAPLDTSLPTAADPAITEIYVERDDRIVAAVRRGRIDARPRISVLVATYDRPELLARCLDGFAAQTVPATDFEIVVIDDGSPGDGTRRVLERAAEALPLVWAHVAHAGRSAAKNLAVMLARGDVVVFFDDDDRPTPELLAEHLRAHDERREEAVAVLGYTGWAPELTVTPLMHYLTDVDKLLFSYGNLADGTELDWRGFWEGRVSAKRAFLLLHALHDQRLEYSIDVEMGYRLARHGLSVVYRERARSHMMRDLTLDDVCRRCEAKGRAEAVMAAIHDDPLVRRYAKVDGAVEAWHQLGPGLGGALARARSLEREVGEGRADDATRSELHRTYRAVFDACFAKGRASVLTGRSGLGGEDVGVPAGAGGAPMTVTERPAASVADGAAVPVAVRGEATAPATVPQLTVTVPVWSRTPELADMARATVERIHDVARLETEVVVVDNGSAHQRELRALVHRFDDNRGVATAWNTGMAHASAPVVAILNSDCLVEPGWDEALYEAVAEGRRIAFPYTDHGDGLGFRQPDQGGTAGWCFMITRSLYDEIGPFDERFNPAYCEDTDYWHRAWQLGVELSPVPAARVCHARRTTASLDPHVDWLLLSHRYLYGWKHGVEPMRAPPYYNREIAEYRGRVDAGATRP